MLRIKDNIDLEDFVELGFERRYNIRTGELDKYEYTGYQHEGWGHLFTIDIDAKSRELDFYVPYSNGAYSDFMFKLYQRDCLECVPEKKKKEHPLFFWKKD